MSVPSWDEIWERVIDTPTDRRGVDGDRLSLGDARVLGYVPGCPEQLAVVYLGAIANYAGYGSAMQWNFARARSRRELRWVIDEISEGARSMRDALEDVLDDYSTDESE